MLKKIMLFVFLCLFSIVSLTMTEEIKLKQNTNTNNEKDELLDIIFTKVYLNNIDITESSIEDNGKTITFIIDNIENNTNLVYQVSNNSDKDSDITIQCSNTKQYSDYYIFVHNYDSKIISKTQINGSISFHVNDNTQKIKDMFMCKLDYR